MKRAIDISGVESLIRLVTVQSISRSFVESKRKPYFSNSLGIGRLLRNLSKRMRYIFAIICALSTTGVLGLKRKLPADQESIPEDVDPGFAGLSIGAASKFLPKGQLYQPTTAGCYPGESSWQAANTMETLANLAFYLPENRTLTDLVNQSFVDAITMSRGIPQDFQHFDDFGWWGLALLRWARYLSFYPLIRASTSMPKAADYVSMAQTVFEIYLK